jgi:hypothetical protein
MWSLPPGVHALSPLFLFVMSTAPKYDFVNVLKEVKERYNVPQLGRLSCSSCDDE